MKYEFAAWAFAAFLFTAGSSAARGQQQPSQGATAEQQKIDALDEAFGNGSLPGQEYEAKLRELDRGTAIRQMNWAGGTKRVQIDDPALGLTYFTLTLPEDWVFQGGMVHGTSCNDSVTPFYRASSPDGLTGFKVFPRFDWSWSTYPPNRPRPNSGCLPDGDELSSADFLRYVIGELHVKYVKDVTDTANVERVRNDWARKNGPRTRYVADRASAITRFNINNIRELEKISVGVICMEQAPPWPKDSFTLACSADVEVTWAPETELGPTLAKLQPMMNARVEPAWSQRWNVVKQQQAEMLAAMNNQFWANMANNTNQFYANLNQQIIANGEATRANMDAQFKVHEQGIAAMQRGGQMNLQRQQQNWNTQQRMADDTCDYALGVQKRYDPTTGQMYKTNSAYTYDWISADGKQHYPTNDINDNPNGRGMGNYTLSTNVH